MLKKLKVKNQKNAISPEEALEFIEAFKKMLDDLDEPTQAISLRVPANLLKALKIKAKSENKKYQSMIVTMIRNYLKD